VLRIVWFIMYRYDEVVSVIEATVVHETYEVDECMVVTEKHVDCNANTPCVSPGKAALVGGL